MDFLNKWKLCETRGVKERCIVTPETYGLPAVADIREPVEVSIFPGLLIHVRPEDL